MIALIVFSVVEAVAVGKTVQASAVMAMVMYVFQLANNKQLNLSPA